MEHAVTKPAVNGRAGVKAHAAALPCRDCQHEKTGARARISAKTGVRAAVGGVDYAVGGWGAYEIVRRRERWEATGGRQNKARNYAHETYAGRTYIHADDAVASIVTSKKTPSALRRAAASLARALGALEDKLCEPDDDAVWECASAMQLREKKPAKPNSPTAHAIITIPPVTSADLRSFVDDPHQEADPLAMYELSDQVNTIMAAIGADPRQLPLPERSLIFPQLRENHRNLPMLPSRSVQVSDDEAVLRLESAVAPYVASIESLQAALAAQLDAAAAAVDAAVRRMRAVGGAAHEAHEASDGARRGAQRGSQSESQRGLTRGEELDAASKSPPLELLKLELPFGHQAFDWVLGEIKPTRNADGIYYGISNRDAPSRSTLLTPRNVAIATFMTSGRIYSWYILDSPEASYAIRASPRRGYAMKIDTDALIAWLQPRLYGEPPHKIHADEYVAHLRELGVSVHVEPRSRRGDVLRFSIMDFTTDAERERNIGALRALTRAEFCALDWTEYDRVAASESCNSAIEVAGDVEVNLETRAVSAPKLRTGVMWGVHTHNRSYVSFHTHPYARYQGSNAEPPSGTDALIALESSAFGKIAWSFVSAPEGTYVMRPSQALMESYLSNPQDVSESVRKIYEERMHNCAGDVETCAESAVRALEDAGFIAFIRGKPCAPLLSVPDLIPNWNRHRRAENLAEFGALSAMSAQDMSELDWRDVESRGENPSIRYPTWLTAGYSAGAVKPSGNGHMMDAVNEASSYPVGIPGPLFVVYFPDEHQFPEFVPHAALRAAKSNAELWAWMVFLGPTRLTLLRHHENGIETYGPVARPLPKKLSK